MIKAKLQRRVKNINLDYLDSCKLYVVLIYYLPRNQSWSQQYRHAVCIQVLFYFFRIMNEW